MVSKQLFLANALALMVAFPATAAEEWERVAPADAKVSVGLDWTKASMGSHWAQWTDNYGVRVRVSSWQSGAGGYPRLEIVMVEAGPGYHFKNPSDIGKKQIEDWSFLKDKQLVVKESSTTAGFKTLHFEADGAKCVYYYKIGKSSGGSDRGSSNFSGYMHGYYCPDQASDLTNADVSAVLRTVRVRN